LDQGVVFLILKEFRPKLYREAFAEPAALSLPGSDATDSFTARIYTGRGASPWSSRGFLEHQAATAHSN
jgi:hypothetical protein